MAFYVTTRLSQVPAPQRRAYAPRTVWLIGAPKVGRSMALVDTDGQSLVTSRIQRILRGDHGSLYVQTSNSLYRLRRASVTGETSSSPSS